MAKNKYNNSLVENLDYLLAKLILLSFYNSNIKALTTHNIYD